MKSGLNMRILEIAERLMIKFRLFPPLVPPLVHRVGLTLILPPPHLRVIPLAVVLLVVVQIVTPLPHCLI